MSSADVGTGTAIGVTFGAVAGVFAYRDMGWAGVACIVVGAWMAALVALWSKR